LPGEIATSMDRRHEGRVRPPRPVLLLLVFGVFLVIVGITATGLVLLTTAHVTTNVLNQAVAADGRIVRGFVTDHLRPDDVAPNDITATRAEELSDALATLVGPSGFARVELRRPDGTLLVDDVGTAGAAVAPSTDWAAAAEGRVAAAIVGTADSEVAGAAVGTPDLLREYFPLVREGRVQAVVALWRDATPIVRALSDARRDILVLVGPEPDYRWRAFTTDIVQLAGRLGVVQWISLGAIPAAVPHTRPVPIIGTEASPGLLRGDVIAGPEGTLRVPSALVSALEIEIAAAGIPALGYFAQVPHYVSGPYATASLELLRAIATHLGGEIPAHELADEARELRDRLDVAASQDETTRNYVERLEAMYDEQRLPSGGDLIADIERFLRDQGGATRG